jgi:hypothetical protein
MELGRPRQGQRPNGWTYCWTAGLCAANPVAGRELGEQRLVETARRPRVEILDGGILPEVGKLEHWQKNASEVAMALA